MLYFLTITILIDFQQFVSCQILFPDQEDNDQRRQRVSQNQELLTQEYQERPSKVVEACPPLLENDPPGGCSETFVEDINGYKPCESACGRIWYRLSGGKKTKVVSQTAKLSRQFRTSLICPNYEVIKQCPPQLPCKLDGECTRPYCNRRGRCWCVRSNYGKINFPKN